MTSRHRSYAPFPRNAPSYFSRNPPPNSYYAHPTAGQFCRPAQRPYMAQHPYPVRNEIPSSYQSSYETPHQQTSQYYDYRQPRPQTPFVASSHQNYYQPKPSQAPRVILASYHRLPTPEKANDFQVRATYAKHPLLSSHPIVQPIAKCQTSEMRTEYVSTKEEVCDVNQAVVLSPVEKSPVAEVETVSLDGLVMLENENDSLNLGCPVAGEDDKSEIFLSDESFQLHVANTESCDQIALEAGVSVCVNGFSTSVKYESQSHPQTSTPCMTEHLPPSMSRIIASERKLPSRWEEYKDTPFIDPIEHQESAVQGEESSEVRDKVDVNFQFVECLKNNSTNTSPQKTVFCCYGDLKAALGVVKTNFRKNYMQKFNKKSVSSAKREFDATFHKLEVCNPFRGCPEKAVQFINECLLSMVSCVRYALIYEWQYHYETTPLSSLEGNMSDLVKEDVDTCFNSSLIPFTYSKCINHLENMNSDIENAFSILLSGLKSQNTSYSNHIESLKRISILSLLAARACLCGNVSLSEMDQKKDSTNTFQTLSSRRLSGGVSLRNECKIRPSSTVPSDSYHQKTPVSPLSISVSCNTNIILGTSLASLSSNTESLQSLRILEYLVSSEELWKRFKVTHKEGQDPSHSCLEKTKQLELRLLQNFPWSMAEIDEYRDEPILVLCFLECVQQLVATCLMYGNDIIPP